ncbi:hypothetical protein HYV87_03450 [Candidatus Woesearchaeota archaeon]|nr:hypothetical protein [Candidatus Woesearchaeota archaeon]
MVDKNLRKLIVKAQSAGKQSLTYIKEDIEEIISQNLTSEHRIESLLDRLLDCLYLGLGEEEFKRLNSYYATINKENSDFYQRSYQEIVEE